MFPGIKCHGTPTGLEFDEVGKLAGNMSVSPLSSVLTEEGVGGKSGSVKLIGVVSIFGTCSGMSPATITKNA